MDNFDICIAGAGVIGLAIAFRLSNSPRHKHKSIVLIEKENSFGQITSSRNSEVIHAGIYYATDSLKAKLCVSGKHQLYKHLEQYKLPFGKMGKLIVAQAGEEEKLAAIEQKANENGVNDLIYLDQAQLREIEPNVQASAALLSPSTGIIDSHAYMQNLLHLSEHSGVTFASFTEIEEVQKHGDNFSVISKLLHDGNDEQYRFRCGQFINCAGLNAQTLASNTDGVKPEHIPKLYACKGDYFAYGGPSPFKHLIYPIPEANHTGLGIHSTLDIGGQTRFGPDTRYVEQLNYDIDPHKAGKFLEAISRYFPAVDGSRLQPAYSGIRPKIAGPGEPAGDFQIQSSELHGVSGLIQLFGMESPGLTSSLAIGDLVANLLD